ncbi:hypothetical protein ACE38W_09740 [Chitinophaga sp. Hz27]|uniref:hypothetical protein n=1 Tax=Chitinophaga sp. Hz27 TaxID=3347169 RepID=UPI0035DFC243
MSNTVHQQTPQNQVISNRVTQKISNKLKQLGYKFPDQATFEKKVRELSGISLADAKYNDIRLIYTDEPSATDVFAIKSACLIVPAEEVTNFCDSYNDQRQIVDVPISQWDQNFFQQLIAFNRLFIYNDTSLFQMVKHHYEEPLETIFFEFGYTKCLPLNNYSINNITEDEEGYYSFTRAVYGWDNHAARLKIRENMLLLIHHLKPSLFVHTGHAIKEFRIEKVPPFELGKLINVAIDAGFTGFVEELCEEDVSLIKALVQTNFANCPLLKPLINTKDYSFRVQH